MSRLGTGLAVVTVLVALGCGSDEARSSMQPSGADGTDDDDADDARAPAAPDADAGESSRDATSVPVSDAARADGDAPSEADVERADARVDGSATRAPDAGPPTAVTLDCGPNGVAIESAGPPSNRVNYVILGDGYARDQLDTLFLDHVRTAMAKRFGPIGEPYGRYRKFVNICALKSESRSSPIGAGPTAFSCSGDDQSRLARCDQQAANMAIARELPASFEVDWKAVVLNNNRWWNTGAVLMLWSGAHKDAAGAALHEGGHGFHQLADEYAGSNGNCSREYGEVNSTADMIMTGGKWDRWLNYEQAGATGRQGVFAGSRYCEASQYRPSGNSMMNSLFGNNPNTSYNAVSREKMIMDIWRAVRPIDETEPPAGAVTSSATLTVKVIDPAVIDVEWTIDGAVIEARGDRLDLAARRLTPGKHTVSARAFDNAGDDLVRYRSGGMYGRMNWARSEQTVTWEVSVP